MSYFIFGGSGFIGSHLVNLILQRDPHATIFNLDIVENNHAGRTSFIYTDVRNDIELPQSVAVSADDVIFNFAAIHRTPGHDDFEYFETNILGAQTVTAFATEHGIRKVVFTSSIAPYAASEEEKFEETLPTPNTPYGISKFVAERIHREWQVAGDGRELTILRPGVVFGLGENGNFTRLYWGIRSHRFAFPGRKDTIKGCIYVKDLVGFMLFKLEHHEPSATELFNCTYEPAYTIDHIVKIMKKQTGLKSWVPLIPTWVLMPAAYAARMVGSPMGICPERVRKLMTSTNISGRKLAQSGYKFRFSFDEAIADWFRDSGGHGMK